MPKLHPFNEALFRILSEPRDEKLEATRLDQVKKLVREWKLLVEPESFEVIVNTYMRKFPALGLAVWGGHWEIVKYLMELDETNIGFISEPNGETFLMMLIEKQSGLQKAVEHRAKEIKTEENTQGKGLYLQDLIKQNQLVMEIIDTLIESSNCDLNLGLYSIFMNQYKRSGSVTNYGDLYSTPLLVAAALNEDIAIKLVKSGRCKLDVRHGAFDNMYNPRYSTNRFNGKTALCVAAEFERWKLARELIFAGADVNISGINGTESEGSPLSFALHYRNIFTVILLILHGAEFNPSVLFKFLKSMINNDFDFRPVATLMINLKNKLTEQLNLNLIFNLLLKQLLTKKIILPLRHATISSDLKLITPRSAAVDVKTTDITPIKVVNPFAKLRVDKELVDQLSIAVGLQVICDQFPQTPKASWLPDAKSTTPDDTYEQANRLLTQYNEKLLSCVTPMTLFISRKVNESTPGIFPTEISRLIVSYDAPVERIKSNFTFFAKQIEPVKLVEEGSRAVSAFTKA